MLPEARHLSKRRMRKRGRIVKVRPSSASKRMDWKANGLLGRRDRVATPRNKVDEIISMVMPNLFTTCWERVILSAQTS